MPKTGSFMGGVARPFLFAFVFGLVSLLTIMAVRTEVMAHDRDEDREDRDEDREEREELLGDRENEGAEVTGLVGACLLVLANIPVVVSLLSRAVVRYAPLSARTRETVQWLNQTQRKYSMPAHYVLNLLALGLVSTHFFLSSCRTSMLPELGLALMILLAASGVILKFRVSPAFARKAIALIHTSPLSLATVVLLLFIGHSIID
jgi:hypothetical protein